jgi:SPP1 family predicted phage head-tail adaptor
MGYSSGMLRHRVTIKNKVAAAQFGDTTGYQTAGTVWAAVDFQRGMKRLAEGALDGTDYVVIRMRYNDIVRRDSQLECEGVTYQITELHRDYLENIIQIKAQEIIVT